MVEDELTTEQLWESIRYLDPESNGKTGNALGCIVLLLLVLSVGAILFALHLRGL